MGNWTVKESVTIFPIVFIWRTKVNASWMAWGSKW